VPCQKSIRLFAFVLLAANLATARDIAVVSNKSNGIGAIALPELVKLGKAQAEYWPNGKLVTFVMRAPDAPEMKMVLEKVYGLPEKDVYSLIASANQGRIEHPPILLATSDEDLVNKVASIPGAVGLVDVYSINSSVTILKVSGKLPLEPGYVLHGN
jgi:hypothetical protein